MSYNAYTENLADFGQRERQELVRILSCPLPDNFYDDEVRPAFNRNSGNVFLVNSEYQVAMMNGENLELFYSTPYSGIEGFLEDLLSENNPDEIHREDAQYILEVAAQENAELPDRWQKFADGDM